ncbi:hypothetical protein PAXINDRAFT_99491 [Paxillus involutus ATCC 200175]|uniref:EF-hand domain-containing protein n=1 Tax=Paxillus involutus ATCC 200175 TaxID=664439 RepID=A0A0C9TZ69_PAXIN|nr:hypothetical protein PAXINDRAFT_99491 [Paxillus involutus ATCC 200175]
MSYGGYGAPPGYGGGGYGAPGGFASAPPRGPPPGGDPQLWSWFVTVDHDGSGAITAVELERALVNGDWTAFDLDTVKLLMSLFDRDRSGTIGFNEFSSLWKYIKDWQNVFRHFDRDRSGSIDGRELQEALHQFGYNLNPQLLTLVQKKYASNVSYRGGALPGKQELRHYAYLAGNKMSPSNSTTSGAMTGPGQGHVHPFYANDSSGTAYTTSSALSGTPDYFLSISASPKFDKHSFEELRIACLFAGKEVGSSEIPTRGGVPAQPAPTLFGRPRGDGFSSTSTLKLLQ